MIVPWTCDGVCPIQSWKDMEYAYAFDDKLTLEQTPEVLNLDQNLGRRDYINRVCTAMRCKSSLARTISDYERRFTDNIGFIKRPKGKHGQRR